MNKPEPPRRTREIEDFTNLYFIHPIGARLTGVLARQRVSPNTVSLAGMICGILAGWAYFHLGNARFAVTGFALMICWHILDGVDGQLARLTNRQSELGKIVDGLADYATFLSVYTGLGLALSQRYGAWVWPLIVLAGAAHSMQATAYEFQRQDYEFLGWAKPSAEFKSVQCLRAEPQPRSFVRRIQHVLVIYYAWMQQFVARKNLPDRDRVSQLLAACPERAEANRRLYREMFSSLVRTWSIMSSNYRTLMIFVCAITNVPLLYFFIEIIGLTPLTLLMLKLSRKKSRQFYRLLDRQAG